MFQVQSITLQTENIQERKPEKMSTPVQVLILIDALEWRCSSFLTTLKSVH